jgi:hypothetical protein
VACSADGPPISVLHPACPARSSGSSQRSGKGGGRSRYRGRTGFCCSPCHNQEDPAKGAPGGWRLGVLLRAGRQVWAGASMVARSTLFYGMWAVFGATAALLYSLLLPYSFTRRFSFLNWQFITPTQLAWSLVLGALVGAVLAVQFWGAIRRVGSTIAVSLRALPGALLGVIPGLLCCGGAVPLLVGALGLAGSTAVSIQRFFAGAEGWFLASSAIVLIASLLWALNQLTAACCSPRRTEAASASLAREGAPTDQGRRPDGEDVLGQEPGAVREDRGALA